MNISHITERLAGCHLGQCAARLGKPCDCGATTRMANPIEPVPQEHETLANPEIDLKGTADERVE